MRKEDDKTCLLVKQSELDDESKFLRKIKLLASLPPSLSFSVSEFRSETEYSQVFDSVWKYYIPTIHQRFNEEEVTQIKNDWETRISFLIKVKPSDYEAFQVSTLKTDVGRSVAEDGLTRQRSVRKVAAITATFYPLEFSAFSAENLEKDTTVVFYSETKRWRPWIGLFIELLEEEDTMKIKVEWLKKSKTQFVLNSHENGSPYYSVVDCDSIMFCDVLINVSPNSDRAGPYTMDKDTRKQIMEAYEERDLNLKI